MRVRLCFTLTALVGLTGLVAPQEPKIIDSPSNRRDYFDIAERLSMDIRFDLSDADAKAGILTRVRKFATTGNVARPDDPGLAKIAADTARAYSELESIQLIYQAPSEKAQLEDALLELLSRAFAAERLKQDTLKLQRFQYQTWPKALPYAERFAGPLKEGDPILGLNITRRIELTNNSGGPLTNCTLAVTLLDTWGRDVTATYFIREWPSRVAYCQGGLQATGAVSKVSYKLYADQLRQSRGGFESEVTKAAVQKCEDAKAVFAKQKQYKGRWQNGKNQTAGNAQITISSIGESDGIFQGPVVRAVIKDLRNDITFSAAGRFQVVADGKDGFNWRLSLATTPVNNTPARSFTFWLADDKISGCDSLGNTFEFKIK